MPAWTILNKPSQLRVCLQADFPALTADNAGILIYVSDYAHFIHWSGTTASFADAGNGYIGMFLSDPGGPGWHLADGSTVSRLNPTGTLTSVTLPNLTTGTYPKLGATVSGVVSPTAAAITGSTASAVTGASV